MFMVTVSREIRALGDGTRRRTCMLAGGRPEVIVFSRHPVLFEELPPEVAADPLLLAVELDVEPLAAAAPEPDPVAPPAVPEPPEKPKRRPATKRKKRG